MVKNRLQCRRHRFDPWVRKCPWRRAWQPTPVFLLGESPWTEGPGGLQSMGLCLLLMLYYFLCVYENTSDICDVALFFSQIISILTGISYQP